MSTLPPLPQINGDIDLMLDVYTHESLRPMPTTLNDDYGDTFRLQELGQKAFELVVTFHLFNERPLLDKGQITAKRAALLDPTTIDGWLKTYGLKEKLRIAPLLVSDVLNNPTEMSNFFYAYVGAVYIRNGLPAVQNWISKLIDPMANVNLPGALGQPGPGFDGAQHPHINAQQGFYTPPPSQPHYAQQNYMGQAQAPPPPLYNPPPLPTTPAPPRSPYGRGGGGSTLSLVTLALVNQTAAQRGFTVTYPAAQEGPPHQPTWTVRCCMDGVEYGHGTGKSQKIAKEEAARMAWAAMGWGPN